MESEGRWPPARITLLLKEVEAAKLNGDRQKAIRLIQKVYREFDAIVATREKISDSEVSA